MNFIQRATVFAFALSMTLNTPLAVAAGRGVVRGVLEGLLAFVLTGLVMAFLAWVVKGNGAISEAWDGLTER